ncbi:unnamed protein product, partial [Prorocentrum cordatum]
VVLEIRVVGMRLPLHLAAATTMTLVPQEGQMPLRPSAAAELMCLTLPWGRRFSLTRVDRAGVTVGWQANCNHRDLAADGINFEKTACVKTLIAGGGIPLDECKQRLKM